MAGFQKKIILTALAVFFLMLVVVAALIKYNDNVIWYPEKTKCPPYYKVVKSKDTQKITCVRIKRNIIKDFGEKKELTKYFKNKNGSFVEDENNNNIVQIKNIYGKLKSTFKLGEKVKVCVPIDPTGEFINLDDGEMKEEYKECNTGENDLWYYGTITKVNRNNGLISSYNIKFLPKEVTLKNEKGWEQLGAKEVTKEECIDCQNKGWVDCPPEISYSTCKKPRLLDKCGKYDIKNERGIFQSEKQKCLWAQDCKIHWQGITDPMDIGCTNKSLIPGVTN